MLKLKLKTLRNMAVAAALLSMSMMGCESMTGHKESSDRSEGRLKDDKNITESVKTDLKNEPVYKFDTVHVETFGGVVQLSGFVNTQEQKSKAAEIASKTSGVYQVVNGIALKPELMTPTGGTNSSTKIYSE